MTRDQAWRKVLEEARRYSDAASGVGRRPTHLAEMNLEHAILLWLDARAGFSKTFTLDAARRSQPKCALKELHAHGLCGCFGS